MRHFITISFLGEISFALFIITKSYFDNHKEPYQLQTNTRSKKNCFESKMILMPTQEKKGNTNTASKRF